MDTNSYIANPSVANDIGSLFLVAWSLNENDIVYTTELEPLANRSKWYTYYNAEFEEGGIVAYKGSNYIRTSPNSGYYYRDIYRDTYLGSAVLAPSQEAVQRWVINAAANRVMSNLYAGGKKVISALARPTSILQGAQSVTLQVSGSSYTPTKDGYVSIYLKNTTGAAGYYVLWAEYGLSKKMRFVNNHYHETAITSLGLTLTFPVVKSLPYTVSYNFPEGSSYDEYEFSFIPLSGEIS